jgi:hypothetical protein
MSYARLTTIVGIILFVGIIFYIKNSEEFANPTTLYSSIGVVKSDLAFLWQANNCDKLWAQLHPTGPSEETSPEDGQRYGQCLVVKRMQTTGIPNISSVVGTPLKK